jgi:hypothetical protein
MGCLAVLDLGCVAGLVVLGCWVWTLPAAADMSNGMQEVNVVCVNSITLCKDTEGPNAEDLEW